ncbi:MAG: amidohydrolase [Treponema sp.]|jgi:amidohydrolase|nr:amidohydrolase [Treponema sp.]
MNQVEEFEKSIHGETVRMWHELHTHPELSMREFKTAAYIEETLRRTVKNIEIQRIGKTGLWVQLRGAALDSAEGNVIILRADMDALPINENNDLPYRSQNPGVMHACGHDVHASILAGTVRTLEHFREKIPGTIWFFFQPGEEVLEGALTFLADPAIDFSRPKAVAGIHQGTDLDAGKIRLMEGISLAGTDSLRISLRGNGGPGSAPQNTRDPISAAAQLIVQLQTIVSRETSPLDSVVLSLCSIHGGSRDNIIPEEVVVEGTLRTFDKDVRAKTQEAIRRICRGTAESLGIAIEPEFLKNSPPLYNDPFCVEIARRSVEKLLGEDSLVMAQRPRMGGEDFAFFSEKIPGVFIIAGSRKPGGRQTYNHQADFYTDEGMIRAGILALSGFALEYFKVPY